MHVQWSIVGTLKFLVGPGLYLVQTRGFSSDPSYHTNNRLIANIVLLLGVCSQFLQIIIWK